MKKLLSALSAAALVAVMTTGVALANHAIAGDTVAPKSNSHAYVAGNPKCGETPAGGFSLKIEADVLAVGNYGPIDITFYDGTYVSWAINAAYLDDYDANQVYQYSPGGVFLQSFGAPGGMDGAYRIAITSTGTIYVTVQLPNLVAKFQIDLMTAAIPSTFGRIKALYR